MKNPFSKIDVPILIAYLIVGSLLLYAVTEIFDKL